MGNSDGVRSSMFNVYRNTVRSVRDREWKLIRYPERDYTQLFNLREDPLEINNLATNPANQIKVNEMMKLLADWQKETGDTAVLKSKSTLPMYYDPSLFKQKPDQWQPEYTLKKYFNK
jgi:arylsulfatase A-like enzyme